MEFVGKMGSLSMGSRGFGATKRSYCVRPVGDVDEKGPSGSVEPVVSVAKADSDEDDSDHEERIRYYREEAGKERQWRAGVRPKKPQLSAEDRIRFGLGTDEEIARYFEEVWEQYNIMKEKNHLPPVWDNSDKWK